MRPRTADRRTVAGLTAALLAAGALLITGPRTSGPANARPPRRLGVTDTAITVDVGIALAWPHATRADLPGLRSTPLDFVDARTAVGTLATRDGAYLRLVVESATGAVRELARLAAGTEPQFAAVTQVGGDLIWAETADGQPWEVWLATATSGAGSWC